MSDLIPISGKLNWKLIILYQSQKFVNDHTTNPYYRIFSKLSITHRSNQEFRYYITTHVYVQNR